MIEREFLLYFLYLPIALGVGILLMGAVLLRIDSRRHKKSVKTEIIDWEETGGKILISRLEESTTSNTDTNQLEPVFMPIVEYVYSVDGKEYHGSNLFPGDSKDHNADEAKAFLDKYPENSYIPVLYDPNDPQSSTLEDHPISSNRMRMFGLLFTWFGISVCCFTSLMFFIMSVNFL